MGGAAAWLAPVSELVQLESLDLGGTFVCDQVVLPLLCESRSSTRKCNASVCISMLSNAHHSFPGYCSHIFRLSSFAASFGKS